MNKTWNYRVLEFVEDATGEKWREIRVVYYLNGTPIAYKEEAVGVLTSDLSSCEGLDAELSAMGMALKKPVMFPADFLNYEEFEYEDVEVPVTH